MIELKLVNYNDPILRQESKIFNFNDPPLDPIELSESMVKLMYDSNALSLSGIQVGIPYSVFVMRGSPQNFACFNPRIVMPSTEMIRLEETSATYPGLSVKVKRPQHCRVRFTMPNATTRTDTFTGITARIFQQNMVFLSGNLFWNDANPIHRDQALKKWRYFIKK